jgi:beta-catenin-like protein 1
MPATPDMQFFDKYKDAADLPGSSTEHVNKKRNIDQEDIQEEDYPAERYQDEDTELDDEEGRFFGGGLTQEQSSILDLVDEYDVDEVCAHIFRIVLDYYYYYYFAKFYAT